MDHNARIQAAIDDLKSQRRTNFSATAKRWGIERTTLAKRFRGQTSTIEDANSYVRQQLTQTQEEALIEYVNKLNDRGFPPTPQILKNIAESIAHTTLGRNWVARFCKRHRTRLTSVYLRTIDHKRKLADNSQHFQHIYNFDEKGFLIGFSRTKKRIVSIEGLKSKRVTGASQDGNREIIINIWSFLLVRVCLDRRIVP